MAAALIGEQIDNEETKLLFEKAADYLVTIASQLEPVQLLYFYARFKQAKDGPCNAPKPSFFNIQAKQKWQAWKNLGNMTSIQAMKDYVAEIEKIDPDWYDKMNDSPNDKKTGFGLGVSISTLQNEDDDLDDSQKTIFDWVKERNLIKLKEIFESENNDINEVDEEGMTLLHWACDRGFSEIVEYLLSKGAEVNKQDSVKQTSLHYACSCGHGDVVKLLLQAGGNKNLPDEDGVLPYDCTMETHIQQLLVPR